MKETIDFTKGNGLVPAIIQDADTQQVLMLGYMNEAALGQTLKEKRITFFSRSKNRLWTKGESSGHFLELINWKPDCDRDALLFAVRPSGPVCHTGSYSCFGEKNTLLDFLPKLEAVIRDRQENPRESSYTNRLFAAGINKIAQKVGEEAVELVIESKDDNPELFLGEAADLVYHLTVLLAAKGTGWQEVLETLERRHA